MKNLVLYLMTILALVLVLILATSCMNPLGPDFYYGSADAEDITAAVMNDNYTVFPDNGTTAENTEIRTSPANL